MIEQRTQLEEIVRDGALFAECASGLRLRKYQTEVARAIVDSVIYQKGLTFVVVFPRQSGKNELQAQIETYLLTVLSQLDTEMVKASPTWKPQTINAMRRLERVLSRNLITRSRWVKESGYIYRFDNARIFFLSGGETANVVGATANTLLECDEAQDISVSKWDKDFAPMAASTNATRVFWGTAWTSRTLLARELRAAKEAQQRDGIRRVFHIDASHVSKEVPAYGKFVAEQVQKLGMNHPLVRTQYYSQEIDAEGGMFPDYRLRLMKGYHSFQDTPTPGCVYALTIDVAGEDEGRTTEDGSMGLANPGRDSTALTIFEVDLSTVSDPLIRAPVYKVVARVSWVGTKHTTLYSLLRSLIDLWRPRYVVVDSTGVGAGLASFLDKAAPNKVIPFLFTAKSKSDLGWKFLAVVETGRYREPVDSALKSPIFWQQLMYCQSEVLEGPGKIMRWGVPDGTRDDLTGDLVHDDVLISAALCAVLDDQEWAVLGAPVVISKGDPLLEIDQEGY